MTNARTSCWIAPRAGPTRRSWLNQIERWFAKITKGRTRHDAFRSVAELERAILDHIDAHHQDPKPCVWTASASLILEKVQNPCG